MSTGSDIVNPLIDIFPNFETIDGQMFANQSASVGTATEIKTGNVHALTRDNGNNNAFRFVATSVFNSGDSFTVDGVSVTGVLPSGESLGNNAFVIGSNVFCVLTSTQLTIFTTGGTASDSKALDGQPASFYLNSANENFDNTGTNISATKTEDAIKEVNDKTNTLNKHFPHRFTIATSAYVHAVTSSSFEVNHYYGYIATLNTGVAKFGISQCTTNGQITILGTDSAPLAASENNIWFFMS